MVIPGGHRALSAGPRRYFVRREFVLNRGLKHAGPFAQSRGGPGDAFPIRLEY